MASSGADAPAIAETASEVPRPAAGSAVRRALVGTFRKVIRLYFRDIERVGDAPPAAHRRPACSSPNHHNALIDPILVLTDAACEISPIAKSTLWDVPGLRWILDHAGAVPIVRRKDTPDKDASANDAVFARIAGHLSGGGNILIFPEGTSHSEPHLAPLRTGAARMLLAADQRRGVPLTFQAVALEFDARDDFRSRCLVLWGPVRELAATSGRTPIRTHAWRDHRADGRRSCASCWSRANRTKIARWSRASPSCSRTKAATARCRSGARSAAWVELAGKTLRGAAPDVVADRAAVTSTRTTRSSRGSG